VGVEIGEDPDAKRCVRIGVIRLEHHAAEHGEEKTKDKNDRPLSKLHRLPPLKLQSCEKEPIALLTGWQIRSLLHAAWGATLSQKFDRERSY
jgi:hypothetical protein